MEGELCGITHVYLAEKRFANTVINPQLLLGNAGKSHAKSNQNI